MEANLILNQQLMLGVLVLLGAMLARAGIITGAMQEALSRIIIDITLPCLILSTFARAEFEPAVLRNVLWVGGLTFANLGALMLVGAAASRAMRLPPPDATVHTLHTMFGNIVFLGFPILAALFPDGTGVLYGAVYQLASNVVTFTYGIYRLSQGQQRGGLRGLININPIALGMGLLLLVVHPPLPHLLIDALASVGQCTSPLSMLYVGALLSGIGLRTALKRPSIYVVAANKLLLLPAMLALAYFHLLGAMGIRLDFAAFAVLVLEAAMPCQTIVVVLTKRYGGSFELAASNMLITTVLSLMSLPIIYRLLGALYGL
ncbi:MAG: AEC family transporter [Bacteroidales bacterium]|nr:AEC family transporter [Bacteroidales bacterium]